MSSDLIAWIVAITLGAAVVGLGLRRKLADTTRNWLPRPGEASEWVNATRGATDGERWRRPLSPRQRRWIVSLYLLMALTDAAFAVLSADNRLLHASTAGLFALSAVFLLRQGPSHASGGSVS
jgi:hypothetical protein